MDDEHKLLMQAILDGRVDVAKQINTLRLDIAELRILLMEIASRAGVGAASWDAQMRERRRKHDDYIDAEFPPPQFGSGDAPH